MSSLCVESGGAEEEPSSARWGMPAGPWPPVGLSLVPKWTAGGPRPFQNVSKPELGKPVLLESGDGERLLYMGLAFYQEDLVEEQTPEDDVGLRLFQQVT